jgi:phosphoglycerate kinase
MPEFLTLDDSDLAGRRVLVRVDFNVPMTDGEVTDATRVERAATTIAELAAKGARVVVLSHFGRPKGRPEPSMSLAPIAPVLASVLADRPVAFAPDCVGPEAEAAVAALADGDVLLLENLRFHQGEEDNDPGFADRLAALGEVYVNDAFSCSHRAHASVVGLAGRLPARAGRLMQAELGALETALGAPTRPAVALVGGAKVSTKLDVLGHLIDRVDALVIGGGMANTFLAAEGLAIGRSLAERDLAETARAITAKAIDRNVDILLPIDAVVAKRLEPGVPTRTVPIEQVEEDDMILDLGPETVKEIVAKLETARTVLWNGPLGAFEVQPFDRATVDLGKAVAGLTAAGRLVSVAGGGDTVAALAHAGVADKLTYVSTAGGAFLEWLEGKDLPGVAALRPR